MDFQEIRDRLVLAALPHVVFEGWSLRVLAEVAVAEGLDPSLAERAFMGGAAEAVAHFAALADRMMEEDLAGRDLAALRVPERVLAVLDARFTRWAPHREAIRRGLAVMALDPVRAARATAATVEATWRLAGERSNDFSWYTKRLTLGAIYSATMLFWLDDLSEDCADTRAFLRRRLADVGRVTALRKQAGGWLGKLPRGVGLPRGL